jgi:endonuclease/exonuclease/phosphatase family metal-dependent hydrolase
LSVRGAVLLSDSFNYPDGPVVGAAGSPWIDHSSGTSANIVSGQLQVDSARSEDISAPLVGQPYTTGSNVTLFASFTIHFTTLPTTNGSHFAHFLNGSSVFRCRIWASITNAPPGFFRLSIANGSSADATSAQLTNDLALNTNYRVAARHEMATGISTLWIDPVSEASPGIVAADAPNAGTITAFAFRQSTGGGKVFVDDFKVGTTFQDVVPALANTPPSITTEPADAIVNEGDAVFFSVAAIGSEPLTYQWQFNGTNILNAASSSLQFPIATNTLSGGYSVVVSNAAGTATSRTATLVVNDIRAYQAAALTLLNYNVKGNGASTWSTNSTQVQALARQVMFLRPDVITFQEIPFSMRWEMTNFVNAFLPGYFLATSGGTDGFICSSIVSRYPITRAQSWLDSADLKPFGYTNTTSGTADNFTRDLFEAEIAVPHFAQPLHVFTTHLKASTSTNYSEDLAKRAAEAAAISNHIVAAFLTTNSQRPYILTGDLNETDTNQLSIQRLLSAPTGLHLTNPRNSFTGSSNTYSTANTNPTNRLDYIMPSGLLFSNINSSQVFRSDRFTPLPPNLHSNDCKVGSDHLPVLMVFNNPYEGNFSVTSLSLSNQTVSLGWQSNTGRQYVVETADALTNWSILRSNLVATGTNYTFTTNVTGSPKFFRVNRL